MKLLRLFLYYYLPPLIWMAVIFYFSSIPDLKSELPNVWDLILRKIAHMAEFGILAVLVLRMFFKATLKANLRKFAFLNQNLSTSLKTGKFYKQMVALAVILTILYAATDELHQAFVPGRTCSIWDLGIDTIGILIGSWVYLKKFQGVKSIKSG